jgi:putative spermidine/putrescine transport system permease protein
MVMLVTVVVSLLGRPCLPLALQGLGLLFYLAVASLIVPSILVRARHRPALPACSAGSPPGTPPAFGAHLTWTLPFGLLIMFAVFNRFDRPTRKRPATSAPRRGRPSAMSSLPLILPSLIGVGLFGFTLSYDEFARSA